VIPVTTSRIGPGCRFGEPGGLVEVTGAREQEHVVAPGLHQPPQLCADLLGGRQRLGTRGFEVLLPVRAMAFEAALFALKRGGNW
jgi:hypothetical protein